MMQQSADGPSPSRLPFKAFLSHRYKSPAVNLYFFDRFSKVAEVPVRGRCTASSRRASRASSG